MYPSLISHPENAAIAKNQKLFLYLTRMNVLNCRTGNDRDLVRYSIERTGATSELEKLKQPPAH
jgi:hypothetical protein